MAQLLDLAAFRRASKGQLGKSRSNESVAEQAAIDHLIEKLKKDFSTASLDMVSVGTRSDLEICLRLRGAFGEEIFPARWLGPVRAAFLDRPDIVAQLDRNEPIIAMASADLNRRME